METQPPKLPDLTDFERMAADAFAAIPEEFRAECKDLVIRVIEEAPRDVLDSLGIDDPLELTGLYEGIALTERSVSDVGHLPPVVWLYRRAILDEWSERETVDLAHLVRHILVHEIAHHFGFSDDQIARIDKWWL